MGRKDKKADKNNFILTLAGFEPNAYVAMYSPEQAEAVRRSIEVVATRTGSRFTVYFQLADDHVGPPEFFNAAYRHNQPDRIALLNLDRHLAEAYAEIATEGYNRPKSLPNIKGQVSPRAPRFALLLIPKRNREHLIGDLEEEYQTVVLPVYGPFRAGLWYWAQTLWAIGPYLWQGFKRVLGWAAIVKLIGG